MGKLNKSGLVSSLVEKGFTKVEAEKAVDTIFGDIADAIVAKKNVTIPHFGRFLCGTREPRIYVHPKTQQATPIGERNDVSFKEAKTLKKRMNL